MTVDGVINGILKIGPAQEFGRPTHRITGSEFIMDMQLPSGARGLVWDWIFIFFHTLCTQVGIGSDKTT